MTLRIVRALTTPANELKLAKRRSLVVRLAAYGLRTGVLALYAIQSFLVYRARTRFHDAAAARARALTYTRAQM